MHKVYLYNLVLTIYLIKMKTKLLFTVLTCFIVTVLFSQSNLNHYKYVIVPKKYDFLKEENQYQLNALTKFLFDKYGFETVMEGEDYPGDMITNRCLALKSDVIKDSGLFKTKLNVVLKDCNDRVVYTSPLGESREKEYAKAYNEALRNAFESFETIGYKYDPKTSPVASNTVPPPPKAEKKAVSQEIEALKAEIETLKKEKQTEVVEVTPMDNAPEVDPVEEGSADEKWATEPDPEPMENRLYAQAIDNGFQLVDSAPKVIYRLVRTGLTNVFLVEGLSAVVYKDGNRWVIEQHSEGTTIKEPLNIKF